MLTAGNIRAVRITRTEVVARAEAAVTTVAVGLVALAISIAAARAQPPLSNYNLDPRSITVSGISSGAYMAHQMHVAHSATITGAALFAGGPYACAGAGYPLSVWRATSICMNFADDLAPFLGPPALATSLETTRANITAGSIDDPANLADDKVYLFSGTDDRTVPRAVVDVLAAYYRRFISAARMNYKSDLPAGHAMITTDFGIACGITGPPYLNDCDYDGAGEALAWLYDGLEPPVAGGGQPAGMPIAFDQREFSGAQTSTGLGATGYLYVPSTCAAGARCRLHIAFHGCQQTAAQMGDAFYAHAGYNRWAEANDIIVLYPQAAVITAGYFGVAAPWPNPKGCWDWWGFTGNDYATKDGRQIKAIKAMIDRLSGASLPASSAPR